MSYKRFFSLIVFSVALFLVLSSCGEGTDSSNESLTESDIFNESVESNDTEFSDDDSMDESSSEESSEDVECNHQFGGWETVLQATCVNDGEQTRKCSVCGFSEVVVINALPHIEEILPEKLSTCTESGLTEGGICSICNTVIKEQLPVSPKGHSYLVETVIDSTCTEKGYTIYKCSCGEMYNGDYKLLSAHTYEETVIPPTCEKEGYTLYECTHCDYSYRDNVTGINHSYKETVISPTCTKEGYTLHKCSLCGDSYKDSVTEKINHTYKETVIVPTCEKGGYTLHKCSLCGSSYKDNVTEKINHIYKEKIVLPTISDEGYTIYTCEKCKYSYKDNYTKYDSIYLNAYAYNSNVLAMGIDVSRWNHVKDSNGNYQPLDWKSIKKAGIDFVILKAGSTVGPDPTFEMNYKGAREAGLDIGAYYYTYALTPTEATKDAEDFISLIKGKKFEYPLYMDFEDSTQRTIPSKTKTEMIKNFATTLQRAGYYAGLYTGYYWMNPRFDILEAEKIIDMLDVWFAHIDSSPSVSVDDVYKWSPDNNLGHSEFGMWQYAHKGVFDFISNEHFDFNYAYMDYPSIIKELGLNGYTPSEEKEYVWVKVNNLNVRSYWDISVSSNILGVIHKGEKYEILEKNEEYVKIIYKGKIAYITGKSSNVSYSEVLA